MFYILLKKCNWYKNCCGIKEIKLSRTYWRGDVDRLLITPHPQAFHFVIIVHIKTKAMLKKKKKTSSDIMNGERSRKPAIIKY